MIDINSFRNKEISWLAFNKRVLQEASRENVPIFERINYMGIYSNNLDEFFRVRVAILKRLSQLSKEQVFEGGTPKEVLKEVQEEVVVQNIEFDRVYYDILKTLAKNDIYIINEKNLNEEQGRFVEAYFENKVREHLMPIILSKKRSLPDLADDGIYLAIYLKNSKTSKIHYALVEVPQNIERFVILPSHEGKSYVIMQDDVIRYELEHMFYMFDFDEIGAYTFKLTRDAELDLNDDISESYVKKVSKSLERRKDAIPVRFVHDREMPENLLDILLKKLNFKKGDAVIEGGRYHNFKDFIKFPKIKRSKGLFYRDLDPIPHANIEVNKSFFEILTKRDILLSFPYHSFNNFIDFLRESSIDPSVQEIKITIYRVASQSAVMKALINAASNGKKVVAIMEIQARFNEQDNIGWANKLKKAGVKVIFGVPGLKVHSKVCVVTRRENGRMVDYAGVGTGNFNEDTASTFADHLLLTKHIGICSDANSLFQFFHRNYNLPKTNHLLISPFHMRNSISEYIDNEIENTKQGKYARVEFKINNLVDYNTVQHLYSAKLAGVDVRLNVRGMFSLYSNFSDKCDDIESYGIIDRKLEHSRIYAFYNNGDERMFISSADLMTRNLDRRIEVACPIYDKRLRVELRQMLDFQYKDNISARILDNRLTNKIRHSEKSEIEFRSQIEFYNWLKEKHNE